MARKIYNGTPEKEREAKKKELVKILSVSERTVRGWLSRIDKDTKAKRNKRVFAAWMACYTQEEIAENEGIPQQTIADILSSFTDFGNTSESDKLLANHQTEFEQPLYDVWKLKSKSNTVSHFGNSEVTIVDTLLAEYTKPF